MSKRKEYGCIYKHTNKIHEGFSYIGQTIYKPTARWKAEGHGYEKSYVFRKAIEKYGWDNFDHEIIEDHIPIDKLDEREQYWIQYYHTYVGDPECKGYNMTLGGNVGRGRICREDTKEKTSNSLKGHAVSEHVSKRVSEASKGRKHTEETRAKIAAANVGRDRTSKPIMCVETGMIFPSINKASMYYKRNKHWIYNRLDNPEYFQEDLHFVKINTHD